MNLKESIEISNKSKNHLKKIEQYIIVSLQIFLMGTPTLAGLDDVAKDMNLTTLINVSDTDLLLCSMFFVSDKDTERMAYFVWRTSEKMFLKPH